MLQWMDDIVIIESTGEQNEKVLLSHVSKPVLGTRTPSLHRMRYAGGTLLT